MAHSVRVLMASAAGALVARRAFAWLEQGERSQRWARVNHRGEPVTLAEGPAVAVGTLTGLVLAPCGSARVRAGAMLGVASASALGALDDLTGSTDVKGLKGHLGALRDGEVTTGLLKMVGLAASGVIAGALARRGRGGALDALVAGGVVAGSANLANLLDLRPGRTGKVFLAASAVSPLGGGERSRVAGSVLAPSAAAVCALLPADLAEQAMLGDTGANALGAAWGVAAAATMSRRALAGTLLGIGALTVLSERISFSAVIDRTPALRYLDGLGRRSP